MERPVPMPLLLEAFPAPPTFLPSPTPTSATFPANPPPSKPPVGPLPPLPGPSRISDTDLLFLASRRSSLLSVSTSASPRSSPRTPPSAAHSLHRAFSIEHHEDDLLQGAPLHGIHLDDGDDDDDTADVPKVMPSTSIRPTRTPPQRESISLSTVAMPTPDDDGPDFDALPRVPSPDIAAILSKTPRPRLSSLSSSRSVSEPWEEDFIDDYGKPRASIFSVASKSYPFAYDEIHAPSVEGPQIVWGDEEESDSDLDLHTALPQVMLHHGFLSPRSKLIKNAAASASLAPSPVSPASGGPPRDTRDTTKRRVRHRDGKMLAGGIGLTTGLGWSDSEDEDAPSPLTHRISTLNLNRSSLGLSRSTSSMSLGRPSRASSLSHSTTGFSSRPASQMRRTQSEYDAESEVDEFGAWRGTAPPTSWAAGRRSEPRLSRVPSRPRVGSIHTDDSAHTTTSGSTQLSLPLMRSRSRVLRVMMADKEKPLPRTPGGSIRRTTSAASVEAGSLRQRAVTGVNPTMVPRARGENDLAMKSTPQLVHAPPQPASPKPQMRPLRLQSRLAGDRAPVPVPVAGLPASTTSSSIASSSSSTSFSGLSASTSATSVSLLSPSPSSSAASAAIRTPSSYVRGPLTPTTPTTPLYDYPQQQQQSGIARPRPRTGTGMVYRTSNSAAASSLLPAARRTAPAKAVAL